jgi:hypothetical protein
MKDKCISCGKDTSFNVDTHIDLRYGYIEGAGQLCINCFKGNHVSPDLHVSKKLIVDTPNDMELGEKVRKLYYESYP